MDKSGLKADKFRFVRTKEVAEILGVSRQQIWRMGKAGKFIPRMKLSDNIVAYRSDNLLDWMNNCEPVKDNGTK